MGHRPYPTSVVCFAACAVFISLRSTVVQAQTLAPLPVAKAAAATELPVGAWGPYSQQHQGPCYLVNRTTGQLFAFPLVVGQQRDEIQMRPIKMPDGKTRIRPARITLERRAMGLGPVQATSDSVGSAVSSRIADADAEGLLWSSRITFAPAPLSQAIVPRYEADGKPIPPPEWGAGGVDAAYFPVFDEQSVSGLLIRVTFTNRSSVVQSFYVDLLGGIETESDLFVSQDLNIEVEKGNLGVLLQHPKCELQFALAAHGGESPVRCYRVHSYYFSRMGNVTQRNEAGDVEPFGLIGKDAGGVGEEVRSEKAEAEDRKMRSDWGVIRISDIHIEPGQSTVVWLSVGVGKDEETANNSAHSLLRLAQEVRQEGKLIQEGVYSQALAAHRAARYTSGDPVLERLMAQSLANIPFHHARRVGVSTRDSAAGGPGGVYDPGTGGWMALGWSVYRPDWSAAQLNAWFLIQGDPNQIVKHPFLSLSDISTSPTAIGADPTDRGANRPLLLSQRVWFNARDASAISRSNASISGLGRSRVRAQARKIRAARMT